MDLAHTARLILGAIHALRDTEDELHQAVAVRAIRAELDKYWPCYRSMATALADFDEQVRMNAQQVARLNTASPTTRIETLHAEQQCICDLLAELERQHPATNEAY